MTRLRNFPPWLAALDSVAAIGLAVASEVWVNLASIPPGGLSAFLRIRVTLLNISFAVVFAFVWKQCLTFLGLYDPDLDGLRRLVWRTAAGVVMMTGMLAMYLEARHARGPLGEILVDFLIAAFAYEMCRVMVCSRRIDLHLDAPERVLIVGSGRLASKAWRELRMQRHRNRQLEGFIDDRGVDRMAPDIATRWIGPVDALPAYLLRHVVDEVIIAAPMRSCYDMSQRAVSIAEAAGLRVTCLRDVFAATRQKDLRRQESLLVELVPRAAYRVNAETAKRIFDVLGAAAGLVLLAPVFLLICLALKLTTRGSIFAVQERHGYGRRCFRMFTFRSETALQSAHLAQGLGRFLKRTLLDKLPELWNVLLGDMSLVGPQAMTAEEISHLDHAPWLRRFNVRPGITGQWQVAGTMSLSVEESMALDSSYIDGWSLALDLKILARTVPVVLKRATVAS